MNSTAAKCSRAVPGPSAFAPSSMPADIISAFCFLVVTAEGSAPRSRRSFMYARSAVEAAQRKGVASLTEIRRWEPPLVFFRRLTSAPRATSSRANSRLVMLPDPRGGGLPLELSPISGFLTHESACNGAKPVRSSFGLAPASISSSANSKCPFSTASINGES